MAQVRKKVRNEDNTITYEYWGSASRMLDIDVLAFYSQHYKHMPVLSTGIRAILAHKAGSDSPERVFSRGGIIISPKRCSLHPTRADKLITSAVRYSRSNLVKKDPPKIPDFGVIDDSHAFIVALDDSAINFIPHGENEVREVDDEEDEGRNDDAREEEEVNPNMIRYADGEDGMFEWREEDVNVNR
jgi:hypothetical protein